MNYGLKKNNILYVLTVLTGLFPYLSPVSFGTDLQPWNLFLLVVSFLTIINKRIDKDLIILFIPVLTALLLLFLSTNDIFTYLRGLSGYLVIALSPIVYLHIIDSNFNKFLSMVRFSTYAWLMVALIQYYINPIAFSFLLNRASVTDFRGVISLAPEASFYGIIGVFYILLFLVVGFKNNKKYILLWVFQILFLAQSSLAILFILIFLFYFLIFKSSIKSLALFCLFTLAASIVLLLVDLKEYEHIRSISLLLKFVDQGVNVANLDGSINDRLSAIYFSIMGFIDNNFMPNGLTAYAAYLSETVYQHDFFWWVSSTNSIMSYYGSFLFHLGFIGLLIIFVYNKIIFRSFLYQKQHMLLHIAFINTILFAAIQITFSMVGMYIALLMYKIKNENIDNT